MADIKIENLSFTYPGETKPAIKNINLRINQGDFVLLCGKSGCGKTTLLRHLKPQLSPYGKKSGKIYFDDEEIENLSERDKVRKIGFVMQDVQIQIVTDKVWHEMAFGLESLSFSQNEIRTKCAEMATYFSIEPWFYMDTAKLSGGQMQILNLASVMITSPEVLILDEPTSQLDPVAAAEFISRLKKINEESETTIIISEHRIEDLLPISDRVIVMQDSGIIIDEEAKNAVNKIFDKMSSMSLILPSAAKISREIGENSITIKECRKALGKRFNRIKEKEPEEIKDKNSLFSGFFDFANIPSSGIYLDQIYFRYSKNDKDILKNFSLHIPKNKILCINGANGSGKTTAISVLAGILKPYRAKVYRDGKKVDIKNLNTAILPQNPKMMFSKNSVEKELQEMIGYGENNKKVNEIAKLMQIEDIMKKHPFDLSGGQMQRVAIAKLLLKDFDILLLDEPTKAMDPFFKEKFGQILKKIRDLEKTVVMVSHDVEFCASCCDISAMFFDGAITSIGKTQNFFEGNRFYTTSANKIAGQFFENSVTDSDVIGEIRRCRAKKI